MAHKNAAQRARAAKEKNSATEPATEPVDEQLCCIPHCDEPGHRLICGHNLCSMDLLKLGKFYSSALDKIILVCPICREQQLVKDDTVMKSLCDTPFKCAVFECPCKVKHCRRYTTVVLRPCLKHGTFMCVMCSETGARGSHMAFECSDTTNNPAHSVRDSGATMGSMAVLDQPGWGLTDEVFERQLIRMRDQNGLTVGDEAALRSARGTGDVSIIQGE